MGQQTAWIGVAIDALQETGITSVTRERLDRGECFPVLGWNAGIEAIAVDGTIIGYGFIMDEDFPVFFEGRDVHALTRYIPVVRSVLKTYGLVGSVQVFIMETDPSVVRSLNLGTPNIPVEKPATIH